MQASLINIFILFMLNLSACTKKEPEMFFLNTNYKKLPCQVYFFKSWSTYDHPVKPKGPLEYEQALSRKGFYRAWMCKKNNDDLFMLFEGIENSIEETGINKPNDEDDALRFYEPNVGQVVGRELSAVETLGHEVFYVSLPNKNKLHLLTQNTATKYEYIYDDNGMLDSTIVTDFDGNVKTFKM